MRAITISEPGDPHVLVTSEVPEPEPGLNQVRVRVRAVGVNRADVLQRRGHYPAPPGWPEDIPGLEYAGEVESVGLAVSRLSPGDCVMGLVGGGAYAEFVIVDERETLPVPPSLPMEQAAAIPEAFITAHDALYTRGGLVNEDTLLIHAVGSGVGLAALQLAKADDILVIGTSRSQGKLERATELGLDIPIHPDDGAFATTVLDATDGHGADVVVDLVGGPYVVENLEATALRGRIVLVGLLAGRVVELDLGRILRKRLTIVGTVLRSRPLEEKIAATEAAGVHVMNLLADARIAPVVDRVLPFSEVAEAHRLVEDNKVFGKVVLTWGGVD